MTNKFKQKRKGETPSKNNESHTDHSSSKNDEINYEENDVSLSDCGQHLYDRFDTKNNLQCNGSEMSANKKLLKVIFI